MLVLRRASDADPRGKLHPNVKEADLYHLFNGSNNIRNITIRVSRGCCTAYITEEEISPSDRCYASVEVIGWEKTEQIFANYDPKNRPMIHGLPVVIALSPADMPELGEILKWAKENKTGYFNVVRLFAPLFADHGSRSTEEQPKSKRITAQKTEIIGEDNTSSLVGPSTSAHPKSRHNPLRRDRA